MRYKQRRDDMALLINRGKVCGQMIQWLILNAENSGSLTGENLPLFIAPGFREVALNCQTDTKKNGHKIIPLTMLS